MARVEPGTVRAQRPWGDDVGASVDAESEHPASEAWRGGGGCFCVAGTLQPGDTFPAGRLTGAAREALASCIHLAWHLARVSAEQSQPRDLLGARV